MQKVLLNTGSNLIVMMVKLVITLIMTPLFVHNLGNHDYGIWEMIGAVLGYMGLLDIGLKPSISRFAAKYKAEGNTEQLQSLYSTAFVFLLFVGLMLFAVMCLWALWAPNVLAPSDVSSYQKYALLLMILALQLLITFPGFVAESFLEGFQKYYLKNNITIFNSIVGAIVLYIYITPENGLLLLAAINAVGLSIKYVLFFVMMAQGSMGGLKPRPFLASLAMFKETVTFGLKSFVQGIASRIEVGSDTLVIGFFLGPAAVPFYAIPANLLNYIRNIGWTTTHAFMPFFSDLAVRGSRENLRSAFLQYSKYVVAFMMPLCVGAALVGPDFIGLWIGPEYTEKAPTIVLILVLYISLPFLNPFSTRYLTAVNKHGFSAKVYSVAALCNLGLSVVLVQYWGIEGVALGSLIPMMVLVPVLMKYGFESLDLTFKRYFSVVVFPVIPAVILMGICVWLYKSLIGLGSYLDLISAVLVGVLSYSFVFIFFVLSSSEKRILKKKFLSN